MKTEIPYHWKYLSKKLVYPYEYFDSLESYPKLDDNIKKNFFSQWKNTYPNDAEVERTKKNIKLFNNRKREELTKIYLNSDKILLTCVFEKFIKVSPFEFDINSLYCALLPSFTWLWGLRYTGINLQTLQDKELISLMENKIRGRISTVIADRSVKSDEDEKISHIVAESLYGWAMSESVTYDGNKFDEIVGLEGF